MDLHVERISKNGIIYSLRSRFFICLDIEYLDEYGLWNDAKMGIWSSWLNSMG